MTEVEIAEAPSRIGSLIERVRNGEEVVFSELGRPVAKLVSFDEPRPGRGQVQYGRLGGQFVVPDDFDAPLPDDLLDLFEGRL